MRPGLVPSFLALLVLAGVADVGADDAWRGDNPRNQRWDVIRPLELNEAFAAGSHDRHVHRLDWAAMRLRTR